MANYTASGKDKSGHKTYRKLQKPRLVNHYVFDPQKNEDGEKYYYSLILLFVPFRDESDLLLAGETAEEAFNRLLPTNDNCSAYHSRLQKILALQATVNKIDEAREADVEDEQPEYEEDDDPQVEGEAKAAMQDVVDMHDNAADTITLEERVDMLNADQRRVFERSRATSFTNNFTKATSVNVTLSLCECLLVVLEVQGNRFSLKRSKRSLTSYGHVWI